MSIKYLLILSTALLFLACNSHKQPSSSTYPIIAERKITMSADIDVEVDNINKAEKELTTLIKSVSGYIENARLSENGHYYANIKVPSDKLVLTLDGIAKLGDKISQSINKQDITEQFTNNRHSSHLQP